ncbi:MAG: threonyl-tRNA synthetase editing domain-containing protein [Candidatus Binatia bacterium]
MRFLILHVNSFRCTITEKGRSKVYEQYDDPVTQVEEALIVLSSVERGDERAPELVAARACTEIAKLAGQLKVSTIVLHPFAHLFAELGPPEAAIEILRKTQEQLSAAGLRTLRTPFGWFNTLQIDAKGHPLSRVARIVTAEREERSMEHAPRTT